MTVRLKNASSPIKEVKGGYLDNTFLFLICAIVSQGLVAGNCN
ncbi:MULTISPECIES: hypothetical protein [Streptococcus]|nr:MULTISPECIES: hypothetical protein [Streptococcus]WCQ70416.1 hypothetical protein M0P24_00875 [Streptococcus pasteurianus]